MHVARPIAAAASLFAAACNPTLPPAPAHANVAPTPHSPPMQACWVEYSVNHMPANYGLAGTSDAFTWRITYSGVLVRHPKGDVVIDVGNSTQFDREIESAGFFTRLLLRAYPGAGDVVATAPEALRRAHEDPAQLSGIVLSHVHADHAGGIIDVPKVPVVLSQQELDFVRAERDRGHFDVVRAHALAIEARARPIRFARIPYENFDESCDFYGDGSIVFVPLFGHTPGSIGTFVNVSPAVRLFHVGDAANLVEAIVKRRGKSVVMEITDHDGDRADATVAKLEQLHVQDPGLVFIAAHDRSAWERAFGAPGACVGTAR